MLTEDGIYIRDFGGRRVLKGIITIRKDLGEKTGVDSILIQYDLG